MSLTKILLTSAVLLAGTTSAADPAQPPKTTVEELRKMKVKELRRWLADRDKSCTNVDCPEKSDLVRFAEKWIDTPVNPAKIKKPLPNKPFWEAWAEVARDICIQKAGGDNADDGKKKVCKNIGKAVDTSFMMHGKRTATKLKKKPDALLKTSWGEIYHDAGKRLMTKLATHCLSKADGDCASSGKIEKIIEDDGKNKVAGLALIKYITNVGVENTNTMFEAMKDSNLNDEL